MEYRQTYCRECGAPLARVYDAWGTVERSRKCDRCGKEHRIRRDERGQVYVGTVVYVRQKDA